MLLFILGLVAGLAILYFGAEWLVRGAASLALRFGIRPVVVGLTVVALGTSMPEFLINLFAAFSGEDDLALGNIVGSNIYNIALILGLSALVTPLFVSAKTLRKEYPIMLAVLLLFFGMAQDGIISRVDGTILTTGLALFMGYIVVDTKRHTRRAKRQGTADLPPPESLMPMSRKIFYIVGGILLLGIGARLMVWGAKEIAVLLGVPEIIIGLTIVAIGTSLPELAASVVGAMKDESEMSLGNVLGSNILNVLFVVGLVSLIRPLSVDSSSIQIHMPIMLAFAVALLPIAWRGYNIDRFEGGFLLAGFLAYLFYLMAPYV